MSWIEKGRREKRKGSGCADSGWIVKEAAWRWGGGSQRESERKGGLVLPLDGGIQHDFGRGGSDGGKKELVVLQRPHGDQYRFYGSRPHRAPTITIHHDRHLAFVRVLADAL